MSWDLSEDTSLVFTLSSIGVSLDMAAYASLDNSVTTCRVDTIETLIEEVLEATNENDDKEDDSEDAFPDMPPVIQNETDAPLNALQQFFQEPEGCDELPRNIGQMFSVVTMYWLTQNTILKITIWMSLGK